MESRYLFIISLVIYIIFIYFINYRQKIVVDGIFYILLIFCVYCLSLGFVYLFKSVAY